MYYSHRSIGRIRGPFEDPEFVKRYEQKVAEALKPKPRVEGPVNENGEKTWTGDLGNHYCGSKPVDKKYPLYVCDSCDGQCGPMSGCNCGPCSLLDKKHGITPYDEQKSKMMDDMISVVMELFHRLYLF